MHIDPALFQENERTSPLAGNKQHQDIGPLQCERWGYLPQVTLAYETWGALNSNRDNAVLVCHALSGDSHAVGWWDRIVGPGKAIDTDKYFVIGSNCLGGCQGSTGPSSLAQDEKPYGSRFPAITVGDMVEAQIRLARFLGIESLLCACGGSMGGMQALEWAVRGRTKTAWLTASCAAHNAMQIGFNEAARQAVIRDPKWRDGNYPLDDPPLNGLSVARMIGHLSYLSDASFDRKFGRVFQESLRNPALPEVLNPQFQIESYLNYQGDKFTSRFDANSLIVLSRAIDLYECTSLTVTDKDAPVPRPQFLFTSFTSDTLYPAHQSETMHLMAQRAGQKSEWHNIDLPFGHDAFLLDAEIQGNIVKQFLTELG